MDEVCTSDFDSRISKLTSLVDSYVIGRAQRFQPPRPCGIYSYVGHPTDQCPTRYEYDQQVHTYERFYEQPRHDPCHDTYNSNWGDHPDFSYTEANHYQNYQA